MSYLNPGVKLFLKPVSRNESESLPELVSYFESELPDNHIIIEEPIANGMLYSLPPGETLLVIFNDKEGLGEFKCVVTERLKRGNVYYIKAHMKSEISYIQRREDFRFETSLTGVLTVKRLDDGQKQEIQSECLTSDVSRGGIALYTKEACRPGDYVTVAIPVGPEGQVVQLDSEVRWCRHSNRASYNFCMGLRFDYLDKDYSGKNNREIVTKYVHQLQRQILIKRRASRGR